MLFSTSLTTFYQNLLILLKASIVFYAYLCIKHKKKLFSQSVKMLQVCEFLVFLH